MQRRPRPTRGLGGARGSRLDDSRQCWVARMGGAVEALPAPVAECLLERTPNTSILSPQLVLNTGWPGGAAGRRSSGACRAARPLCDGTSGSDRRPAAGHSGCGGVDPGALCAPGFARCTLVRESRLATQGSLAAGPAASLHASVRPCLACCAGGAPRVPAGPAGAVPPRRAVRGRHQPAGWVNLVDASSLPQGFAGAAAIEAVSSTGYGGHQLLGGCKGHSRCIVQLGG